MSEPLFTTDELAEITKARNAVSAFDDQMISWLNEFNNELKDRLAENQDIDLGSPKMENFLDTSMVADIDLGLRLLIIGAHHASSHYVSVDPCDGEIQTYTDDDIEFTFYIEDEFLIIPIEQVVTQAETCVDAWVRGHIGVSDDD